MTNNLQDNGPGPRPREERTGAGTETPPRPVDEEHLGFSIRKAVKWFSPATLARAAAKVVLAAAFGDYLDKREMEQSPDHSIFTLDAGADGDVWIDFIADTADGFNQTYSVAWCASQARLEPATEPDRKLSLPRAQLVVFGGDEVYPYATPKEYEDRFCGPYRAALPFTKPDVPHPLMLAIPGNHDWYDGLTGFMRVFAQPGWIGGRRLEQKRSYFVVDLPGPFWLWGLDIQSDSYVDAPQIEYFRSAAEHMKDGDALILCTAKPSWTDVVDSKDAYRNLSFVERTLVPPDVRTVLMLSGDSHHYARYEAADDVDPRGPRMKVTAGGGGAFLSATTRLDETVSLPLPSSGSTSESEQKEPFELQHVYPSTVQSRRLTWRIFLLGLRNPTFLFIPAILYALLYVSSVTRLANGDVSVQLDVSPHDRKIDELLLSGISAATVAIVFTVVALLSAFYIVPKRVGVWPTRASRLIVGVLHTGCHVFAAAAITSFCFTVFTPVAGLNLLWSGLVVAVGGGVVGSFIFASFLFVVFNLFGWNSTEAFSSFRYSGYKNFLRLKVTDKAVTVYPIGIDKICRKWDYDRDNPSPEASWLAPHTGDIQTRLIEPEFTILASPRVDQQEAAPTADRQPAANPDGTDTRHRQSAHPH